MDDLTTLHNLMCASALRETYDAPGGSQEFLRQTRRHFNYNSFPTDHGPIPRSQILTGHDDGPPALVHMKRPADPWSSIAPLLAHFPHLAQLCDVAPRPF